MPFSWPYHLTDNSSQKSWQESSRSNLCGTHRHKMHFTSGGKSQADFPPLLFTLMEAFLRSPDLSVDTDVPSSQTWTFLSTLNVIGVTFSMEEECLEQINLPNITLNLLLLMVILAHLTILNPERILATWITCSCLVTNAEAGQTLNGKVT